MFSTQLGAGDARKAQKLPTAMLNMNRVGILARKEVDKFADIGELSGTGMLQNLSG
jgi:hypothetical protein